MKLFGTWRKEAPSTEAQVFTPPADETASDKINLSCNLGKGRKILVVDDNAVVLKTFELKLKSYGFEIITATEGAAAISVAQRAQPDLILLDINFPPDVGNSGMQWNGFNIMQWLGRFKEVASIPVVVITSGNPDQYKQKALAAGAVGFFQKPIKFDEFLTAVDHLTCKTTSGNPV